MPSSDGHEGEGNAALSIIQVAKELGLDVSAEGVETAAQRDFLLASGCRVMQGFFFAKPTTFDNPMFKVDTVDYYAVDHTPSYLWESASRALSAALIVHLPTVTEGRESWKESETIRRAINIDSGVIQAPAILAFQNRQPNYPHAPVN